MSLQQAQSDIKAAGNAAIDAAVANASNVQQIKADLETKVQQAFGRELGFIVDRIAGAEAKADAWIQRHVVFLRLAALCGWLAAVGEALLLFRR